MIKQKQNINWVIDAVLLVAFLLEFFLKLTGVDLHQWLGIGIALLVFIHFILHWKWVQGVFRNFFTKCSSQARWYAFLDLILIIGFIFIGFTGLLIATWFTINIDYIFVIDVHVAISFITLAVLLVKVALHYKWIISTTKKLFGQVDSQPMRKGQSLQPLIPCSETLQKLEDVRLSRRRFVGFMGLVTAASVVALYSVTSKSAQASAEVAQPIPSTQTPSPTATSSVPSTATQPTGAQTLATAQPTVTAFPAAAPTTDVQCIYRCRKGLHCAYPGRCRDYVDLNGNGLCDNGECL